MTTPGSPGEAGPTTIPSKYHDRRVTPRTKVNATFLLVAGLALACERHSPETTTPPALSDPADFLADMNSDVVALVTVASAETRWVILPEDGDHVPIVLLACRVEEPISTPDGWPKGQTHSIMQFDHTPLIAAPMAPPAMEGRRYLVWANRVTEDTEIPAEAPWIALTSGVLLVRGTPSDEWVYWSGKRYSVASVQAAVARAKQLPLDQIADPARRIDVGRLRLARSAVGDVDAFIRALVPNIIDPDGQAKLARPRNDVEAHDARPHALWLQSLALLRDLGQDEQYRASVVAALEPIARTAPERVRLCAALALAQLGSDAGHDALVHGYEVDMGQVSSDTRDESFFPGSFPFDRSSKTACSYALALLGDRRGLDIGPDEVRLAAAEALLEKGDRSFVPVLEELGGSLEEEVFALAKSGELTKARERGDFTRRYPEAWVRTHALQARAGRDESLRLLVDAYVVDFSTYPADPPPLLPRARPGTWSGGPGLEASIVNAEPSEPRVLERVATLFSKDDRWNQPAFLRLRASLGDATAPPRLDAAEAGPDVHAIALKLASKEPRERAEALGASGYHRIEEHFDEVLRTALTGAGEERVASLYALGFYRHDIPEATWRQLLTGGDLGSRFSALAVATRSKPARFAAEAMSILEEVATTQPNAGEREMRGVDLSYLAQMLSRLTRGPLPKEFLVGLSHKNARVRWAIVRALGIGGNPAAFPHVQGALDDTDEAVRKAAQAAVDVLGGPEE